MNKNLFLLTKDDHNLHQSEIFKRVHKQLYNCLYIALEMMEFQKLIHDVKVKHFFKSSVSLLKCKSINVRVSNLVLD